MKLKQFIFAFMAMLLCFSVSVNAQVAKVGDTEYATLQAALDAAAAGTGNVTVAILADVNLTGVDWNPVTVSAPGYPVVTVEGNGKTITGLNDMLFAGTWAGKSGLIIKNLTIANSAIVNDKDDAAGNVGVGAFIGYPQASATITLENCHLKNSSVEGGHWTGGLIGMAGGYNGADGPVFMNLTIKGCSVTGSTITGKGSVGGVIGHGSCAAWTNVVIEKTTVSDNTITSTGSSNVKAGAVMGTIGAAGQPTTVNGVTHTGGMSVSATVAANTVESNGTKITTIYGRQGTETGMLYIAGGSYDKYPIEEGVAYAAPAKGYKIVENNGTYGIVEDPEYGKVAKVGDACFETLAQAVEDVEDGGTITLIANETFTENNRYNNGGWWDGLGYSGDKSFTIDLAGFTISQDGALNDYLMWFKNDGAKDNIITLKNGTLDAGTTAYCALATASSNAQKITVNLENIQLINNNSSGATLKIRGGAELNANAGTIITGKNSYLGIEAAGKTTVVNIYEGAEIYQNGTSSYCGCLAGASGNSTINVYGGKGKGVSGGFIAMTSGGTINVEGGEWIANTDGTYANSNKSVLVAQSDKGAKSIVNVTGGTFKGGYNCYGNKVGDAQINIKGGNFNADPTSYVAEDYIAVKNNGVWNVELAAAKIGTTAYATFADALAAVKGDDTLTLLADLNLKEILTINKAITFDGNGKTLTSSAGRAINVSDANGVTIKNLTINASGERAINIIQNATNVTIEKVTATAKNYTVNVAASAPNAVVAIKNSTLNGLCTVNVAAAGAKVTVDNSIVNCNDNNTTAGESYAALCLNKAAVGASIVATNTTVNVTEGSDSEKGRNGAENGTVTINGSTEGVTVTVAVITYPGSDNYHGFTSLADAIEFAKAGNTITLIRDITASNIITINKAITFDGNGKKLTSTAARAINVSGADGVTIKNLTINASGERAINVIQNATNVTVDNVTATAANYTVNVAASAPNAVVAIKNSNLTGLNVVNVAAPQANVTIAGGKITCNDQNDTENYAALALNKDGKNATIAATDVKFDIKGDSKKAKNGAEGGVITIDGKTDDVDVVVAYIDNGGNYYYGYPSLKAAIAKAKEGETITLLRDLTMDYNARDAYETQAKNVVINGNGKTLTLNQKNSDWASIGLANNSKLVLNNMTIEKTGYGDTSGAWNTHAIIFSCPVEMNDVTVNNSIAVQAGAALTNVTINEANGYYGLWINGNGQEVTINGGAINATNGGRGIKIADQYIDAPEQVTLNVTGTKFNTAKKAAVLVSSKAGANITASNVNIENVAEDKVNFVWVDEDWAQYSDKVEVTGASVRKYTVSITTNGAVKYYQTIADAIAAAQDGETITVLQDIEVSETLVNTKKVTLDLNGKTISQEKECTASYEMINNKGNLTITGDGKLSFKDTSAGDPNFGWGSYTVRNEGTLVVEDGTTIEHKGAQTFATHMICAIFQYSGSTTINGGTISTPNYRSARLWKGDMTINGGTFDGQLWVQAVDNTAKLTINGGTFEPNGGDASAVFVTNNQYDVQFAVTDGTFNGKVGCSDATKLAGAITGGKFNEAAKNGTNAALLATGFIFGEAGTDGYYEVKDDPSTLYIANLDDLKAFRDAVNNGTNYYAGVNVYLAADIDMAGENWVGIGTATKDHGFMGNFDGQGYKIKNLTITNPTLDSDGYAYAGLFGVTEGTDKDNQNTIKNLTIENVTITTTGNIAAAAVAYPYYTIIDNVKVCGDIKIQGGDYTAGVLAYTRRCVNASNLSIVGKEGSYVKGNITVGGVISDIQMNGGLTADYKNFSAEGLTISGEKSVGGISGIICKQTLDGATVKNVTLNSSDARVGIVSGSLGDPSTISNVIYENVTGATAIVGATWKEGNAVEAKIGDTYYATLAKAIAAAEAGETVTMLTDVTLDDALIVEEGMDVTINGKGKTITGCDGKDVFYVKGGKLTLTEGLNVHATTDCAIYLRGGDVFTAANLTKSGDKYSVIQGNGNYAGNVTITGGKVEASGEQTAIYWPQNGKLTITGGEITGHSAVYIASGSLEITGGKLHGVGANGSYEGVTGGSANAPGEALTIENVGGNSGYELISSVVITGGTFISDNAKAVGSYANTTLNPEAKPVAGFIKGGTFSSALEASYCAEGYGPYAFENGTFGVEYLTVEDITIVDGELTEFVNQNEKTVKTLTYKRTFTTKMQGKWQTLYVPFEIPVSELTAMGYDVAYFNDFRETIDANGDIVPGKSVIEMVKINGGTLKANYPYVIRAKTVESLEMNLVLNDVTLYSTTGEKESLECSSAFKRFTFYGTYKKGTRADFTGNNNTPVYAMNPSGGMQAMSETAILGAFRVYMTITMKNGEPYIQTPEQAANASIIPLRLIGEEDENGATIIYDVVEDSLNNNGNDFIYDLQGRRVSEPKKGGIYIKNGKKILF